MKTFNDYPISEGGIDKVVECAPYINEILADSEIMGNIKGKTWVEVGALVVKEHGEAFEKIRQALGNEEEAESVGLAFGAAQLMHEILSNQDIVDYFISFAKK